MKSKMRQKNNSADAVDELLVMVDKAFGGYHLSNKARGIVLKIFKLSVELAEEISVPIRLETKRAICDTMFFLIKNMLNLRELEKKAVGPEIEK